MSDEFFKWFRMQDPERFYSKELSAKDAWDFQQGKLKVAVEALSESWKLLENSEHCKYANKAYYIVDKALAAINGEGV
jgi:hypothetical protein